MVEILSEEILTHISSTIALEIKHQMTVVRVIN